MKQTDRDRISTRQLNRLRRRILRVYGTARRDMQKQLTEFLTKYKQLDERKRACSEIRRWSYFKGKRLPGLAKRREAEFKTCMKGQT